MAVPSNTAQTHQETTIREDMDQFVELVSPVETPFMSAVGRGKATSTYHEWTVIELAPASDSNAAVEGDDAQPDAQRLPDRVGNYTQIATKAARVAGTEDFVKAPGQTQSMKQQIVYRSQEIKRDMEKQMLSNKASSAGSSSTARVSGSFSSWLETNVDRGVSGSSGGFSGSTVSAPSDGTQRTLTESMLKDVISSCWTEGATPKMVMVGSHNKEVISGFTGNATRFKSAEDKKLIASIDVYASDFGEVQIVPNRFSRERDAYVIDPSKVEICYLREMQHQELAKTGDAETRQVLCEYSLKVSNEKAHGVVADLSTS